MIFIFSSVLFAFWLSDRSEKIKLKETELIAIQSVYAEMQSNLEGLKVAQQYHNNKMEKMVEIISGIDEEDLIKNRWTTQHLMDSVFNRRSNALGVFTVRDAAYRTLEKSNAFLLVDYDLARTLSEVYQYQTEGVKQTGNRFTDELPSSIGYFNFKETRSMILLCLFTLRELNGQKIFIIRKISDGLSAIEKAYPELVFTVVETTANGDRK